MMVLIQQKRVIFEMESGKQKNKFDTLCSSYVLPTAIKAPLCYRFDRLSPFSHSWRGLPSICGGWRHGFKI